MPSPSIPNNNGKILSKVDNMLDSYTNPVMFATVATMYALYIIVLLGISSIAPNLLSYMDHIVRVAIGLFLLIRFNPLRKRTCTAADSTIVFFAAILMLSSQGLTNFALYILDHAKWFYNSVLMYLT